MFSHFEDNEIEDNNVELDESVSKVKYWHRLSELWMYQEETPIMRKT